MIKSIQKVERLINMKKIVFALVLGMLIGSSSIAIAATNDTIQAKFSKFMLKIDDKEAIEIEPLTYKGTTYIPLRYAAELLGHSVGYEDETRTITLDSIIADPEPVIEEPVTNETVGSDKVETTEEYSMLYIDGQINSITNGIRAIDLSLRNDDLSEERRAELQKQKVDHQARLEHWQEQKALKLAEEPVQ
jgi:hypothetical protein